MKHSPQNEYSFKNELLTNLPEEELQRLVPHLKKVELRRGEVLHEADSPPAYVYFIEEGVAGLSVGSENGNELNLSIVGNESTVGERAIFRKGNFIIRCEMVTDGSAFVIQPQIFHDEFYRGGMLHNFVIRRIETRLTETSQTALCSHSHYTEQRLSRWLLTLADRLKSEEFDLTQDYIANLLGIHRPGVTIAAKAMQDEGLIRYTRGHIRILDRKGLEKTTCECYKVIKEAVQIKLND